MWIDENDAIFEKLSVWMKNDPKSDGALISLKDSDIGAIHLAHAESEINIFDKEGNILGIIAQNGVALSDEGKAYNVQSLDIVI